MPFFQKAPSTQAEAEEFRPLDIPPDEVLELTEAEWYARVYRGDSVPQLTLRATLMGSVLGFLLAFTNLYIGLKTGWGLGVAITACILSYSIWSGFRTLGIAKSQMTILETNCMQSTASAAGYSTGGFMVSAVAALLLLSATSDNPRGEHLSLTTLALWTVGLAALGTIMAIPMKRNMINRERLKFPSGTAAAVTLQSLYSEGAAAIRKAKALAAAALFGAIFPAMIEFKLKWTEVTDEATGLVTRTREALWPAELHLFDWLAAPLFPATDTDHRIVLDPDGSPIPQAQKPSDWLMVYDLNPVMIAAGALVGLRIALSMMIGGLVLIFALGEYGAFSLWESPQGDLLGAVTHPAKAWKEIGLWLGVPIMLSYGLLQFATQWRTILRAFTSFRGDPSHADTDPELVARTEVPSSWFLVGGGLAALGVVILANHSFGIPIHFGLLAVGMSFFLALVAARATGESDITPVGAMGKIMQLTFGTIMPQAATANLMSASITANTAGCSADLLTDLKSGYLLGANPRRQFLAQMTGIIAGTCATVFGFRLLVPDATVLTGVMADGTIGSPEYPAPAAQAWMAVAKLMTGGGLDAMHPVHRACILWGLLLGAAILIAEMLLPKRKKWLPSATGLGLGLILPFQYPLSMLLGAMIAAIWTHKAERSASEYMVPIVAGLIAGISLTGVLAAILNSTIFVG